MLHRTADAEKYTQLLLSHVNKSFSGLKNFLFIGIGNMDVLKNLIKATDDKCNIYIIDEPCLCKWFSLITWKDGTTRSIKGIDYDIENFKKDDFDKVLNAESYSLNETMKFDYIIMNPPYEKNLHLKILESVIDHIDDNGEIINLSPVRWLQDPLAKYKKNSDYNKFEKSVAQHIESLDVIPAEDASKIFNVPFLWDLGVYFLNRNQYDFYTKIVQNNTVFDKTILATINGKYQKYTKDEKSGNIKMIIPHFSGNTGKKDYYTITSKNFDTAANYVDRYNQCESLVFDDMGQARNWHSMTHTIMYKYIISLCKSSICATAYVPYLPNLVDTENPRTHKIGYESDWTNEDLCNVFGITGYISDTKAVPGSEWEEVLKTMEKYV